MVVAWVWRFCHHGYRYCFHWRWIAPALARDGASPRAGDDRVGPGQRLGYRAGAGGTGDRWIGGWLLREPNRAGFVDGNQAFQVFFCDVGEEFTNGLAQGIGRGWVDAQVDDRHACGRIQERIREIFVQRNENAILPYGACRDLSI